MVTHLKVHVVVCADKEALVLHPPLETNKNGLAGLQLEERLWVDGLELQNGYRNRGVSVARSK